MADQKENDSNKKDTNPSPTTAVSPFVQSVLNSLNIVRVLVFLEDKPQSNKYHQILLTDEGFKKVSDSLYDLMAKNPDGSFDVPTHSKEVTLPDLESSYTPEQISKM